MAYIMRLAGGHSSGSLSRFVRSAVAAVALVAPITQPSAIAQAPNQDLVVTVDAVVEAARSARSIPGVAVVITRGDEVLLAKGFGFADVESALPITPSTVFQIGSISKQFTAAAAMKLVEMRRCSLDDSIVDLMPGLSPDWRDAHRFVSASDPEAIGVTFECSKSTCNRIRFRMAGMIWYGDRIDAHSRTLQTN
jgi:CubicO group peptidase (beta-lactamase class C family)